MDDLYCDALKRNIVSLFDCIDTLVISDYAKGTCSPELIKQTIRLFRDNFVVVNGKPVNLPHYKGASLIIFNFKEAQLAYQQHIYKDKINDPLMLGRSLQTFTGSDILITLGAEGMLWTTRAREEKIAAVPAPVADVTGAGDTVTATIALRGRCSITVLNEAAKNAAAVVAQYGTVACGGKE